MPSSQLALLQMWIVRTALIARHIVSGCSETETTGQLATADLATPLVQGRFGPHFAGPAATKSKGPAARVAAGPGV